MRAKKILRIVGIVLLLLLLSPLWMYLAWLITPKKPIRVAIVDKTVLTTQGTEHESFNWVLKNQRFCRPNGKFYDIAKDYFGFFPGDTGHYELKGFEQMPGEEIDKIASRYDMIYITDAYGIYYNEWYKNREQLERSPLIYGGLSLQDIAVLKQMKDKKKLIITEFNTIASPTPSNVINAFETTFDLHWTGWVGRYFNVLDSTQNPELPHWLTRNYKKQHNNLWPFKKSGIVFVRQDDHIEVLELARHLNKAVPIIITDYASAQEYHVPTEMKYPYWFDIIAPGPSNKIRASYHLDTNHDGDILLNAYHIPKVFPAVLEHYRGDYKFFYFCGDFADNPVSQGQSYFKGIGMFSGLFYDHGEKEERLSFFWNYYRPMMSTIINRYYEENVRMKAR